jgi:hypothetical protein
MIMQHMNPRRDFVRPKNDRLRPKQPQRAPDRIGHRYDRVYVGGESRNHLGDVYTRNVTYNYGALYGSKEEELGFGDATTTGGSRLEDEMKPGEKKRATSGKLRREFLEALRFDAADSRMASIGPAYAETCSWIVEAPEYLRWRDESCLPEHHGVLWNKGNPGSGKSTLMRYALSITQRGNCKEKEIIVSFFFNARGKEALERSAEGMYRSLLCQTLERLPHLNPSRTHVAQDAWPIELLENLFRETVLSLETDKRIVCYIDALDECTQDEVRDVVLHFEDLVDLAVSWGSLFSICFSSRHYPHITMHKFEELNLDDCSLAFLSALTWEPYQRSDGYYMGIRDFRRRNCISLSRQALVNYLRVSGMKTMLTKIASSDTSRDRLGALSKQFCSHIQGIIRPLLAPNSSTSL